MLLVDAVIETARSDVPDELARYRKIAPSVLGNLPTADAPRELLRQGRLRGYDSTFRWVNGGREAEESFALEQIFLERFVAAVHAGRWFVRAVPRGELTASVVDPRLITVEAFKRIKGDQEWELAGTMLYGVDVVMGPPPSPEFRPASDLQIHDEIKAEYDDCEATGRKPPNVKQIGKPVQDRLRTKGLYATKTDIQKLAGDKRYTGLRRLPGKTVASERS